ncbi:hypothetical protein LPMP_322230 [Leishmania panamensis]|uniref:Uncharacterized protein n=1 Tax=Leishmania panamensis TaxID=5679 RepID=A0A088SH23_LEIPA|nr:hypothetical protein LPMP_322230 [Leishmania panamensis]AIO01107.1 hypothetical protein LPMP_322230 [Leishmania panamensis]
MNMVELHPHFVAACNYADVSSVVGLLKEPIDSADFKTNNDAPYLPATCTSTIHLGNTLRGLPYSSRPPPPPPSPPRKRNSNVTTDTQTAHDPSPKSAPAAAKRPPLSLTEAKDVSEDGNATPLPVPPPSKLQMPNDSRLRLSHRPSLKGVRPSPPKVLCIWDVDDTLVASGVSGVRQNTMFRDSELVALFSSAGDSARHLLLSQGSIDDVFGKPSGRLRCVLPFLERTSGCTGDSCSRTDETDHSPSALDSSTGGMPKEKSFFTNVLRCVSGSKVKERPSSTSSVNDQKGAPNGNTADSGAPNEHDLRYFSPGTVVVRLSTVRGRSETTEDSAFLTDTQASPTCSRTFDGQMDDKAEQPGRWLILRPEIWGITLASVSTFFAPSRNTAFVNGKVYRKMDVVWSLAMSSEWDSVFFIDNNLSEVGVVRYGLQISDALALKRQRKLYRFFQADYLLLATSAKLREMELRYGRDITRPPNTTESSPLLGNKQDRRSCDQQGSKEAAAAVSNSSASAISRKSVSAEEACDLKRTKSAAALSSSSAHSTEATTGGVASSDAGHHSSWRENSWVREPGTDGVTDDVKIVNVNRSDRAPPHPDVTSPLVVQHRHGSCSRNPSECADCLSLTFLSCSSRRLESGDGDLGTSAMMSSNSIVRSPKHVCKDVDLFVVNLHMPSEAYRRVLTTARTNSSGQRSMQRVNRDPNRHVGQPVFVGDRSCTDEQYRAILRHFQEAESTLFQFIEEEIRANGFVDVTKVGRWVPNPRLVYTPVRVRPTSVPHMLNFYNPFFVELEEGLVAALQRTGGTSASCVLHTEAQRQYYILQRVLPFLDPYLTGDLSRMLFDIYITDGNIPLSLAEQLKKTIVKTRACIQPVPKKKHL